MRLNNNDSHVAQAWDRGLRNYLGAPSIATSAFTETSGDQVRSPALQPQHLDDPCRP